MKKHFINNLVSQLNCISRISAIENASRTQKQVDLLIDSIRYKSGRENQIIRVKKELNAVANFVEMFKIRFGEAMKCTIHADEESLNVYIPHYTIMTFVENCMYHAFDNIEGVWEVEVIITQASEGIKIQISDNGIGFKTELYTESPSQDGEYGTIPSTISRLARFSKDKNTVSINSSRQGTSVTIIIPYLNEGDRGNA